MIFSWKRYMIRARLVRGCADGALQWMCNRRKRKCRQIAPTIQTYMWRFHRMPFVCGGGWLVYHGMMSLCFSLLSWIESSFICFFSSFSVSSFCFIFLAFSVVLSFASCVLGYTAFFSFFLFSQARWFNVRAICVFAGTWGEIVVASLAVSTLAVGITAFSVVGFNVTTFTLIKTG